MNPQLLQHLASRLDVDADNLRVQTSSGGDINQAFRLVDDDNSWFVKINLADCLFMFEAEQRGLDLIQASNSIRVPLGLGSGQYQQWSYLLLEYIDLRGNPDSQALAVALAAMHGCQSDSFGNDFDNTIGSTPQVNTRENSWTDFWSEHRIGHQISLMMERGLDKGLIQRLQALQSVIDYFFRNYSPLPSLLHGDLWSGNWAADAAGQPVIYDPACYFGDHEADLAMMELFGSPGDSFFRAYHEAFPIDPGYGERKLLYNLYHIVNHALLFGGGYANQASRMADQLLHLAD